jgi:hypothetical protein
MQGKKQVGKKHHKNGGKNDGKNYHNKEQAGTRENMDYHYHDTGHRAGKIHNIVQANVKRKLIVINKPV